MTVGVIEEHYGDNPVYDDRSFKDLPLEAEHLLEQEQSVSMEPQGKVSIFHPNSPVFRFNMMVCACLLTFGSYYCYDIPGAITNSMIAAYDITQLQYTLYYSVYSLPNVILPLCGGWIVDRVFGVRLGGILFCSLVLLGQLIWASGSILLTTSPTAAYYIGLVGRFVFGLGGESLSVTQSAYLAKWFSGKELNLAFGITLSFSRIGSAINFLVSPAIDDALGVGALLWFGAALCLISVAACLGLAFLDLRGERQTGKTFAEQEKIQIGDIRYFPLSYWLVVFVCVTFYISIFSFITIASAFFQHRFGFSQAQADHITSIPYILAAFISPVAGFVVDKVGYCMFWVMGAAFYMSLSHLTLSVTPGTAHWVPYLAVIVIGCSYSICAASLWPAVALLVKNKELGTAYGMMTSVQNTGLFFAPLLIGAISNDPLHPHYNTVEGLFFIIAGVSFLLCLLLVLIDIRKGDSRILTLPAKETHRRQEIRMQQEISDDREKRAEQLTLNND